MNFRHILFLAIFSWMTICNVMGQDKKDDNILLPASSSLGNFIYLYNGDDLQDSLLLANTDYFEILRTKLTGNFDSTSLKDMESKLYFVGQARRSKSVKEFKNFLPDKLINAMKISLKVNSDEAFVKRLNTLIRPIDFFMFYFFIETRLALGHVFLDKDVKEGEAYLYYVYKIDKNKKRTFWGKTAIWSKIGNYKLSYFNPKLIKREVKDSSIAFQWAVPIAIDFDTIVKPIKRLPFDLDGSLYNTFFVPSSLRAKLQLCVNNEWKDLVGRLNGLANITGDTLFFNFFQRQLPGDVVRASIQLEDEVYNTGNRSDTVNAFLITDKSAPRITRLNVRDTLNAIAISWTNLKSSPYLAGVQIIKYWNGGNIDTLPILPISDSIYLDYQVKIGINYRYEVRALYQPALAAFQTIPSSGVATLMKLSRPDPPFNLKVKQEGKHVRLNWETANDPTIESFYIYRGITPNSLSLLPSRVPCCTFLDTTMEMSGGSQYFYAVNCQNVKQDSSIYSNVVVIVPNRKIKIAPPNDIHFYLSNDKLNLSWQDSRHFDNNINGFIIEKRIKENTDTCFRLITPNLLKNSFFRDTSKVSVGITYQYRAYSIAYNSDTSVASEIFEWELPKARVDVLDKFYVLPKSKSLTISIPPIFYENRKAYKIFRKKDAERDFILIATIPSSQFLFDDTDVVNGETYHYCIAIVHSDGREGRKSFEYATLKK